MSSALKFVSKILQYCTHQYLVRFDKWRLKKSSSRSYIFRVAITWLVNRWTSWQHLSPRMYHRSSYKPDITVLTAGARLV